MSQTFGGTRWKRFAVVMVPTIAATAAVGVSIAQGALAASFSVSGVNAVVTAGELDGSGFTQYGTVDVSQGGKMVPVAVSGFNSADITKMCQSVPIDLSKLGLGTYTLKITAGDAGTPVHAEKIFLDMTDLQAQSATFHDINIGVAEGAMTKGPVAAADKASPFYNPSGFGQEAHDATLIGVKQASLATSAGTFVLNNMHLSVVGSDSPCQVP